MKLLINTATTFKGGGVQVANSFIHECRKYWQYEYHVVLSDALRCKINKKEFPKNFYFYNIPYRPAKRVFSLKPPSKFFRQLENRIQPDIVFTTSGPAYWKPKVPHLVGFNLGHNIYKDSPFFQIIPFHQLVKWRLKGHILKYFFKRESDAFVVQTNDVNQRLKKWLNTQKPLYTVSNTCSHFYFITKLYPPKLPNIEPSEFRFLLLSSYYRHKNIEIIPKIFKLLPKALKRKVRFVLTLETHIYEQIVEEDLRKCIYNTGPINMKEAPSLYQECSAVFLPTLLECFSASYPEAMAMEKPIITTDLGFSRSICQDAAIYYDPLDPSDAAEKIGMLIKNVILQNTLIRNGKRRLTEFDTPELRAFKYLNICGEIIMNER